MWDKPIMTNSRTQGRIAITKPEESEGHARETLTLAALFRSLSQLHVEQHIISNQSLISKMVFSPIDSSSLANPFSDLIRAAFIKIFTEAPRAALGIHDLAFKTLLEYPLLPHFLSFFSIVSPPLSIKRNQVFKIVRMRR